MSVERITGRHPLILPVVLVGGKSTRFGRDKLREPLGACGTPLVQRPTDALRGAFGPVPGVHVVGACHESVVRLADGQISDEHPGKGPIGGIISALRWWVDKGGSGLFVLAGDMPGFTAADVQVIMDAATAAPDAWAVLAVTDRLHPCVGLYRPAALAPLIDAMEQNQGRLSGAVPDERTVRVACPARAVANVNTPGDLGA